MIKFLLFFINILICYLIWLHQFDKITSGLLAYLDQHFLQHYGMGLLVAKNITHNLVHIFWPVLTWLLPVIFLRKMAVSKVDIKQDDSSILAWMLLALLLGVNFVAMVISVGVNTL